MRSARVSDQGLRQIALNQLVRVSHVAMLITALTFGAMLSNALAQSSASGTLHGIVRDSSGGVIPGVAVTARSLRTTITQSTVSGADGEWTIAALQVGPYELSFELNGFKKLVRSDVVVEAAVPRALSVSLEIGSLSEQINVSAALPILSTSTPTTFRSIDAEQLTSVPTSTRSFTHLLSSEPGVSSDLPPALINGTGNISPSVNGTRTTSTSLFFNGIDATNLTSNEGSLSDNISPAPEMLEEVKLQTSLYDATVGRSGGGNFQLITRSGSNAFRGSAFGSFQHENFNANDFFYERDGIDKPKARRNEGGFTLGGPVIQNRLFFFGGYQRTDAETGFVPTASSVTVLPAALRLINGARTKENIWEAFRQLNPNIVTSIPNAQGISDVAIALLNLRNPVTGDFVIPAPREGLPVLPGTDLAVGSSVGGNQYVRQRNVVPADFQQDQVTFRLDGQLTEANRLSGTVFYAKFPGLDPFPDPNSLASPFTLRRADRNVTTSISDTHVFGSRVVNELRGGLFDLNNSRQLDDPFLGLTNASVGVPNPATSYDSSNATLRLGHYVGRPGTVMERFSFGGPNDSFNKRRQRTWTLGDTLTWVRDVHTLRLGGEFRHNEFDTNLPEEQATEFEKFDNFTQFLRGVGTEADTQFGITDKQFRFNDFNLYFADDWRLSPSLSLNVGVRYEFFGWPIERNGRIGNVDFDLLTNTENPVNAFIVPGNVQNTGFVAIDSAIAVSARASNNHTLKGQDWNNVAPRLGFAWAPGSGRSVLRGGYGVFFDRPSAGFINTVFSNYPFLREVEVTAPSAAVPIATAYSQQDPSYPFNQYLPNRLVRNTNGTYQIRDGTQVTRGADGSLNTNDPATGQPTLGNVAETFEFRAIDRNLRTPYVQQYNLGLQHELTENLMIEARYVGSKGSKLLEARALNQGYDLNAGDTPDHIFKRFNDAYVAAGSPNGPLNDGATQRAKGVGKAFGFFNAATGAAVDYNLSNTAGAVIGFEARGPILGFNVPEAILLANTGRSLYHSMQLNLVQRMSSGLQFNVGYTFSRSMDTSSADPGSTAGGGKPDTPNVGFSTQGNQRDLESNYARSDFDRPHRFSGSFVYELPGSGFWTGGFRVAGFGQVQSGVPYSIYAAEPEISTASVAQYSNLVRGSGGLYRLAFGRPSLCGTLDQLKEQADDPTEGAFNQSVLCSPMTEAGGYPNNLGFGNLGRNVLRGLTQKRFDMSLAKRFSFGMNNSSFELRWDIFNLFNTVNYALPNNVIGDPLTTDFGKITDTVGGPRVMQFGLKLQF